MKIGDWTITPDEIEDIVTVELSVEQARELAGSSIEIMDKDIFEDISRALDEAQSPVFSEQVNQAFILIRIRS